MNRKFFRIALMIVMLISSASAWADNAPALGSTEGLRKVNLTATKGDGFNMWEGCNNIFDHDTTTKWFREGWSIISSGVFAIYVEFQSTSPFVPKGYSLTTANDNDNYKGRNPSTWKLLAKNPGDATWTTIVEVTDDRTMQDVNYTQYDFAVPSTVTEAYQCYRFEIYEMQSGKNQMQLSELSLWKAIDPNEAIYDINLPSVQHGTVTATVDGKSVTKAYEGDNVTLTFTFEDGYTMDAETFSAKDGSNNDVVGRYDGRWKAHSCTYKFTMPASAVTVNGVISAMQYWINSPDYGEQFCIEPSTTTATYGQQVTLTVKRGAGVVMEDLKVSYRDKSLGEGKYQARRRVSDINQDEDDLVYIDLTKVDDTHYTFSMPAADVMINVKVHYEGKYALNRAEGLPEEAIRFMVGNIDATSANEGDLVRVEFGSSCVENVSVKGQSGEVTMENDCFTMPAEDVTVSADLKYQLYFREQWYYSITATVDGKPATTDGCGYITPGKTVTLAAKSTDSDLVLSFLDVNTHRNGFVRLEHTDIVETSEEGYPHVYTCTFVMPYSSVDVEADFGNPITVSFDPNGGSGKMDDIINGIGGHFNLPQCGFTAPEGYDFAGWKVEWSEELMPAGEEVSVGWENMTITAQWKENVLELADAADNASAIQKAAASGKTYNRVVLTGRTLYCDGEWNTLCLPFDVSGNELDDKDNPLHRSTIMELDVKGMESDGITPKTRLDNDGTLYLAFNTVYDYFHPCAGLKAGVPYIIKWAKADDYDKADPQKRDLADPVFRLVTINDKMNDAETFDQTVIFKGTYAKRTFNAENKDILFLGAKNKLYYPQPGMDDAKKSVTYPSIGAFRAYFQLNEELRVKSEESPVKEFRLNFGEDEETPLFTLEGDDRGASPRGGLEGVIYDLSGRKINCQQSPNLSSFGGAGGGPQLPKGIYIQGGKKVLY